MILGKENVVKEVPDKDTAAISKLKALGYKEVKQAAGKIEQEPKTTEKKELKVEELRQIAKEAGIEGASALSKAELTEVLREKGLI